MELRPSAVFIFSGGRRGLAVKDLKQFGSHHHSHDRIFFGFWRLEIPLAYGLAIHQRKHAFWAIVIAEAAIAGASAILFKRGRWKKQKI